MAAADEELDQQQLAERHLAQAREQGVDLVGPNGLLNQQAKKVLEAALDEEMSTISATTRTTRWVGTRGTPQRGSGEDGAG